MRGIKKIKHIWLVLSWALLAIFFIDSFNDAVDFIRLDAEKIEVELEGEREIEDSLEDKLSLGESIACICQELESATKTSIQAHSEEQTFHSNPEALYILYHQLKSHLV